jgi:hypothetical protein
LLISSHCLVGTRHRRNTRQGEEGISRLELLTQSYICNELVWLEKQKFDLRMYWLVASVDPPIVLYHDGIVRVGSATYDEMDFSTTYQHLTILAKGENTFPIHDFWELIRTHYNENHLELSKKIKIDPVQHVRNQMKEALGTMVSAFMDVSFGNSPKNVTPENLFSFYGADFVIDKDLGVWFIDAQMSPGFGIAVDHKVELLGELFRPMVDLVEEIHLKQEADPQANILPLKGLGEWEIVYAGDWQYTYEGYERSLSKKGCVADTHTSNLREAS